MGQLGIGMGGRERKFPAILKGLLGENIVDIAAGSLHTLALSSEGHVFSWGCNDTGALGKGDKIPEEEEFNPSQVKGELEDKKVVQIKAGAGHSFALTDQGELYSWGIYKDIAGGLGHSKGVEKQMTPSLVGGFEKNKKNRKVLRIASGESLGLALLEDGTVYQWGDVSFGKRSSERFRNDKVLPSLVTFKKSKKHSKEDVKIVDVFAGGNSCFALTQSGKLWVWGPNNYGQTGIPRSVEELAVTQPLMIDGLDHVVQVAAASHHAYVLCKDHKVYSFGRGHSFRLGHGDEKETDVPLEIKFLSQLPDKDYVVSIGSGEAHGMAVTAHGALYTWGYGDLLQLGSGEMKDEPLPRQVKSQQLTEIKRKVVKVSGGSQHSCILAIDA